MAGLTDLTRLLADLDPDLHPEPWVYATVADVPPTLVPFAVVREDEGVTVVVTRTEAERLELAFDHLAARITLRVHSALEAVGLTAAVARALTEAGLSCNVVAGYHHDHLFVPWDRRDEALAALRALC